MKTVLFVSLFFWGTISVCNLSYSQKRYSVPIHLKSISSDGTYQVIISTPRISANEDGHIVYPPFYVSLPLSINYCLPGGNDYFFGVDGEVIRISYFFDSKKEDNSISTGYLSTKDASAAFKELKELSTNKITYHIISGRYNGFIQKGLFYIELYNIKKRNIKRYIELLSTIKIIENDVSKTVDGTLDSLIHEKSLISMKRKGVYNSKTQFIIKDIKQVDHNMFFIKAQRNDSTFYICSYDNMTHIANNSTIEIGASYNIRLVPLWKDYSNNVYSRHIKISFGWYRFFFGWEENHFMIYFAKDLNGIYLEL